MFFFCLVFAMPLFICALWLPAEKGLTSWLSIVVSKCEFGPFPIGIQGQVWYLIVSIPDLCTLTYFVSTKIYDKRDDYDFEIVNFPFLDGDVPRSTSYQLIHFAR